MLIIGAKGFAKEVLEILYQQDYQKEIFFYDDVSTDLPERLFNQFTILRSVEEVKHLFTLSPDYTIGIGEPSKRHMLYEKFKAYGGIFKSVISPYARIGHFGNKVEEGCNIMTGTVITNDITIGKGCLINLNCTIGHDTVIGEFSEMSPGVHVSGNCKIGSFCNLGTNCTVLPKITIGDYVTVGAGAVVTRNVESNLTVVGTPAKPLIK